MTLTVMGMYWEYSGNITNQSMLLDLETYWTIPNCQPWWRNQALKDAFWVLIYFPQKQVDPTDPATSERTTMSLIPAIDGLPGDLISPDDPKISVRILISDQKVRKIASGKPAQL